MAVKPPFLYRWRDPEDRAYVSRWTGKNGPEAETGSLAEIEQFRQRQISRMVILGATAENKLLLQESYLRILVAFEPHVGITGYLFGSRPSLADFAWLSLTMPSKAAMQKDDAELEIDAVDRRPSWGQRPAARVLPSKRSHAEMEPPDCRTLKWVSDAMQAGNSEAVLT